ncbi:TPA: hypothetical protein ACH3X1_000548 [Trebouxia sp. C0004]
MLLVKRSLSPSGKVVDPRLVIRELPVIKFANILTVSIRRMRQLDSALRPA